MHPVTGSGEIAVSYPRPQSWKVKQKHVYLEALTCSSAKAPAALRAARFFIVLLAFRACHCQAKLLRMSLGTLACCRGRSRSLVNAGF